MLIRIAANLSELRTNLKDGKDSIETTTQAMTKLASSFQGDKLIQQAHNVVAAVNEVGGASKLTESEQARVNATLDRAIDKYGVLGKEAPRAMQDLYEATKKTVAPINELDQMTAKFVGELGAVNQNAMAYVAAVERIGGASKLTSDEQARINASLTTAITKYQALGQTAPAAMVELEKQTRSTEEVLKGLDQYGVQPIDRLGQCANSAHPKFSALRTSVSTFDNALQAMGLNVMPVTKGIDDIASAAGRTTKELGGVATAGLAIAAAYGGWQLGRMIADWFNLDKAVEQTWQRLLGYANMAAETAGAKQDVINRAIAAGAKETITYKEAIEYLTQAHKRDSEAKIDWAARLSEAQKQVRNLTDAQINEIEIAKQAGASTEQLTDKYHLSALALSILDERHRDVAKAIDEHKRKSEELAAAKAHEVEQLKKETDFMLAEMDNVNKLAALKTKALEAEEPRRQVALAYRDAIYASAKASNEAAKFDEQLATERAKIDEENKKLINSYATSGKTAVDSNAAAAGSFAQVAQQVTITGDAVKEYINLMRYTNEANAILQGGSSLFTTQSQRERVASLPARAGGGPVSAGRPYMVGERGPEVIVPERSGTVIPNGGSGGGGVSVTIQPGAFVFTNTIANDPRSLRALGDLMSIALLQKLRGAGVPLPAGV